MSIPEDDLDRLLEEERTIRQEENNAEMDIIDEMEIQNLLKIEDNQNQELRNLTDNSEEYSDLASDSDSAPDVVDMTTVDMHHYIFHTPPDGSSLVCKLNDNSMVFLKRNKNWMSKSVVSSNVQCPIGHNDSSSTRHIEQLIDQVREARARREQLKKEIISKGKERKCLIDWGNLFQPHSFIHLLSDGLTNRVFMKWLTQWKPLLFHTSPNPSTAEVDSLPFFCPECHKGGFHAASCRSQPPLRPEYRPDLPSPLPQRPLNPLYVIAGPTGCGKSTLVQVAARAQKLRVVALMGEANGTSLHHTLEQIETVMQVRGVSFGKEDPPLILLDNFDSSFSQSERKAIAKLLLKLYSEALHDSSKLLVPVVITCVDPFACNLQDLKSFQQRSFLPQITQAQQVSLLQRICSTQNIPFSDRGLRMLSSLGEGDLRFVLSSLQSIVWSYGKVEEAALERGELSSKEVIQGINYYFKLIFVAQRNKRKSKSPTSNCAAIMDQFFNVDPNLVEMGVFEALPQISIPDSLLSHYITALDCLVDYDLFLHQSYALVKFELQNTLPVYLGIVHTLYRREPPVKLPPMTSKALFSRDKANNLAAVKPLRGSTALRQTEATRTLPLIMDYLSVLLCLITPTIRPVDTLLMTLSEKRQIERITELMANYGIGYESVHVSGVPKVVLKPNLVSIASYPELSTPFESVSMTVRFKMQAELQKALIRGHYQLSGEELEVVSRSVPVKRSARTTPRKKNIPQESPLKKLRPEVTVEASSLEGEKTAMKVPFFTMQQSVHERKSVKGIVYRFQKGYTCAVRQPATIRDLI